MWKKIVLCCVLAVASLQSTQLLAASLEKNARAVLKFYVNRQTWDQTQPWSKRLAGKVSCTGFVIKQGVMTNAHCVADATFIQIEIPGVADKIEGRVKAVNHQMDLAIVEIDADRLPSGTPTIRFGDLPEYRQKVVTVGYPTGGRQVSFTEGVVSRIDVMGYAHSYMPGLLVQTDAAINPGNSGGPVFDQDSGKCLGVATQKNSGGEGLGYFVPTPMIEQFLNDIDDGKVDGIPNLGIALQNLENDALRASLNMPEDASGIRVRKIAQGSSADGVLKEGDIITSIDGEKVLNDGRIPFRKNQRIGIGYKIYPRDVGESVKLGILRDGKAQTVKMPLKPYAFSVIPTMPQYDEQPRYSYYGGLLFRSVEPRYMMRWGRNFRSGRVPVSISQYLGYPVGENNLQELVVIGAIFEADINKGYVGQIENIRIETVNGKPIHALKDVHEAIKDIGEQTYIEILLEDGVRVVLDRNAVEKSNRQLRKKYHIPADAYNL